MKKHFVKVLSIMMALTMVLSMFAPFAVNAEEAHVHAEEEAVECTEHVYGEPQVKEPECGKSGEIYAICTTPGCGDKIVYETIDASVCDKVGHAGTNYVYVINTVPDCENDGTASYVCPICGEGTNNIPVKKLGHDYTAWNIDVEETCTTDGSQSRKCQREGCTMTETQVRPALEHGVTNANPQGWWERVSPSAGCDCYTKLPDGEVFYQQGKCYQQGYEWVHCTKCHAMEKREDSEPVHNWVQIWDAEAEEYVDRYYNTVTYGYIDVGGQLIRTECIKTVTYYKRCNDCGYQWTDESKTELADGHNFEKKEYTADEKKTAAVAELLKTANKGKFLDDLGWEKVVATIPCVVGAENYYIRECIDCDYQENVNYWIENHKMDLVVCSKGDSCDKLDAKGNCADCTHADRKLICSVCKGNAQDKHADDHAWKLDKVFKAATCTTNRIDTYKCENYGCNATENREVADTKVANPTKPAEHSNWIPTHKQPSTCTVKGFETGYCTNCSSDVETYELPLAEHVEKEVSPKVDQTCIKAGKKAYIICDVCGADIQTADVIPADGKSHPNATTTNKPVTVGERIATCEITGAKIVQYPECGCITTAEETTTNPKNHVRYTYDNKGNATGSTSLITAVALKAPTCTEDGNHAYSYCAGCKLITAVDTPAAMNTACKAAGYNCTAAYHKAAAALKGKTLTEANKAKLAIAALGHHFPTNPQVAAKAETCNANGWIATWYCDRACCASTDPTKLVYKEVKGVVQNGATVAPHGTDYIVEYKDTDPATCTEAGTQAGKFCSKCEDNKGGVDYCSACDGKTYVIPALGHNIQKHTEKCVVPAIGVAGFDAYKCTRCDAQDLATAKLATGSKATYTANGIKNLWYVQGYTAALVCEHNTYKAANKAPTCEDAGYESQVCTVCGELKEGSYNELPALGHKDENGHAIYLDCQNYKTHAGITCDTCGRTAGELVHHNFVEVVIDPTCELAADAHMGDAYYECEDCKVKIGLLWYALTGARDHGYLSATWEYKEDAKISMNKADYVKTISYVPATSAGNGSWEWLCVCGENHVTTISYEHNVEFDIEVNPYTSNVAADQLTFVNGGLVEVLVSVTADNLVIKALTYDFQYDASVLEFVSAEIVYDEDATTEGVQNGFGEPIVTDNIGNVKTLALLKVGVEELTLNGNKTPLIKYVFKIGEGVKTLAKNDFTLVDPEFNAEVAAVIVNNQLKNDIKVNLMGDLTGDGKYTVDDVIALQNIVNENGYSNVADFNNDGATNLRDFGLFAKFITSNMTVVDYYTLLGVDIVAEVAAYDYADYTGDGAVNLSDAEAFEAALNALLGSANYKTASWSEIVNRELGNVENLLAAADANA